MERHGKEHMAAIGKLAFEATVNRHWQGDRQGFRDYLHARAHDKQIDSFVSRELDRRLAAGEPIACEEMIAFSDPDEGPPF